MDCSKSLTHDGGRSPSTRNVLVKPLTRTFLVKCPCGALNKELTRNCVNKDFHVKLNKETCLSKGTGSAVHFRKLSKQM